MMRVSRGPCLLAFLLVGHAIAKQDIVMNRNPTRDHLGLGADQPEEWDTSRKLSINTPFAPSNSSTEDQEAEGNQSSLFLGGKHSQTVCIGGRYRPLNLKDLEAWPLACPSALTEDMVRMELALTPEVAFPASDTGLYHAK